MSFVLKEQNAYNFWWRPSLEYKLVCETKFDKTEMLSNLKEVERAEKIDTGMQQIYLTFVTGLMVPMMSCSFVIIIEKNVSRGSLITFGVFTATMLGLGYGTSIVMFKAIQTIREKNKIILLNLGELQTLNSCVDDRTQINLDHL